MGIVNRIAENSGTNSGTALKNRAVLRNCNSPGWTTKPGPSAQSLRLCTASDVPECHEKSEQPPKVIGENSGANSGAPSRDSLEQRQSAPPTFGVQVDWFWVDDGFACGAIAVRAGVVVECAPIWRRRWKGRPAKGFPYRQARRLR